MTTDFLGGEAEGASSLGSQVSFVQETQLTPETFASQELSKMAVAQVPLHIYDSPLGKEWDIDELSVSPQDRKSLSCGHSSPVLHIQDANC